MKSAIAIASLALCLSIHAADAQTDSKPRPTIGLALEGGGALGLAHVGLLEWFEQHHIPIDYLAGTSIGGLVGGFYASGMTAPELRSKIDHLDLNELVNEQVDYKNLSFRRKQDDRELGNTIQVGLRHGLVLPSGLNSGEALDLLLSEIALPYGNLESFNDLPTPFRCVATDLVSAKQKVFDAGRLGEALRATMSIPGLYDPVLRSTRGKETQEYVDGGLLNDLPVDLVKAMGADIVIAVYLATDPYDPNKPHNALGVLGRSLSVVMAANERHNIEQADILVSVNLSGYSVSDFSKAQEIMARGIEGAERRNTLLDRFALGDSDWRSYLERRQSKRKTVVPPPRFISIEGVAVPDKLSDQIKHYFADQIGKPVDVAWLDTQIDKIMGMGVFAHISYAQVERDGVPGLAISVELPKSRPPTLQPAPSVNGSDYLNPRYAFTTRITASDFGGFRSELRTDFVLGSTYGVGAEYFHPFTPLSHWFIAPHALAENLPLDFYHRSDIVAFDREYKDGGGVDVGYSISNTGEVRFGYEADHLGTTLQVGSASAFPILSGPYRAAHLSYVYDHVDDEIVPHSGLLAKSNFRWVDANPGSLKSLPVLDAASTFFQPISKRSTVFVSAEGGTTFNTRNSGIPLFFLGGPQRLSAYGMNELFGNQYFLGRVGFLKQVNASIPFADGRIYLFADYEVAKMYGVSDATAVPMDANAGVLVRTVLGPLFLGGSLGDAGHRKFYFQLGRFF
jgi:NTE family protein